MDEAVTQSAILDRRMGITSLLMWLGTAVRVYPLLSLWENLQSVSAMVVMFALLVAWPTWGHDSYQQWRIPVLSFTRIYVVALPFNFSTAVFDAIAPHVGTGRFALVSNVFQLFLAIRIALLTFTSLGFRVPFRLHLLLQTINVAIFIRFGLHPYCHSKMPDVGHRQQQQQQQPSQSQMSESDSLECNGQLLAWLLHWWVVLMVAWRVSCYAAGPLRPMFLFET